MQHYRRNYLIVGMAILFFIVAIMVSGWQMVNRTDGQFVYIVDDAYIHMSVSKNVIEHGVWGSNSTEFSFVTSSLIYPILVSAVFLVTGTGNIWIPLLLNILAGVGVLYSTYDALVRLNIDNRISLLALIMLIIAVPLPLLTFMGMEHIFHVWFFILMLYQTAILANKERESITVRDYGILFLLAFLQTGIRYEGMFTIACVAIVFILYWRLIPAILTIIGGAIPVGLFAAYSVSKGSLWLPNSVYLKGSVGSYDGIGDFLTILRPDVVILNTLESSVIWLMTILVVLAVILSMSRWQERDTKGTSVTQIIGFLQTPENAVVLLFIGSAILHSRFVTAKFLRYEAYLIGGFIFISAWLICRILSETKGAKRTVSLIALAGVFLIPSGYNFLIRTVTLTIIPDWSNEIYSQQYQFAHMIAQELPADSAILLNDIGTTGYFTEVYFVDLLGLANIDVARARAEGLENRELTGRLIVENHATFAIIHNGIVGDLIPLDWIPVATWSVPESVILFEDSITFYGSDTEQAAILLDAVKNYEAQLPDNVIVCYVDEADCSAYLAPRQE